MFDKVRVLSMVCLGVLSALLAVGCADSAVPPKDKNLVLCDGRYLSPTGRYVVIVPAGSGIRYAIENANTGATELNYRDNAGRHMLWFLYWGNDDSLWHYSGDNGRFMVWRRSPAGAWISDDVLSFSDGYIFNDELIRKMPPGVLANLEPALRERWGLVEERDAQGNVIVTRRGGQPDWGR